MTNYLHGYSPVEQQRLILQAEFLRPYVYPGVDLRQVSEVLEVGCGVGAQTQILLELFPSLRVTGVDLSKVQLAVAEQRLSTQIAAGKVKLLEGDAQNLATVLAKAGLAPASFQAAFLCWFLEHVPSPLAVLKEVWQNLKPGGQILLTEVNNSSLFLNPYAPHLLKYWYEFNDLQWSLGGHPYIGLQLGNLLTQAGFVDIELEFRAFHLDHRDLHLKTKFIDYFFAIFASGEDHLIREGRIDSELLQKAKVEFENAKGDPAGVFYYSFVRAKAFKSNS